MGVYEPPESHEISFRMERVEVRLVESIEICKQDFLGRFYSKVQNLYSKESRENKLWIFSQLAKLTLPLRRFWSSQELKMSGAMH